MMSMMSPRSIPSLTFTDHGHPGISTDLNICLELRVGVSFFNVGNGNSPGSGKKQWIDIQYHTVNIRMKWVQMSGSILSFPWSWSAYDFSKQQNMWYFPWVFLDSIQLGNARHETITKELTHWIPRAPSCLDFCLHIHVSHLNPWDIDFVVAP